MLTQLEEIMTAFLGESHAPINPEAQLFSDLGLGSMDLVNMVGMIEDTFDLAIPDEELRNFVSVKDVLDYLESHVNE